MSQAYGQQAHLILASFNKYFVHMSRIVPVTDYMPMCCSRSSASGRSATKWQPTSSGGPPPGSSLSSRPLSWLKLDTLNREFFNHVEFK